MAVHTACGSSQARDWIQATAATFNPLHWAQYQTWVSIATWGTAVRFLTHCTTAGTPRKKKKIFLFFFGHPAAFGVPLPGIRSEPQLWPEPQLWQHQILHPLCGARDWACIPVLPRCRPSRCTTAGTPQKKKKIYIYIFVCLFVFCLFVFSRAAPGAYGGSQARGLITTVATGLHHSHSNAGSEPHLWPTPQLMATPDPSPTEQGRGSNPRPHGS